MAKFPVDKAVPGLFEGTQAPPSAVLGWAGFLDARFILESLGILLLASLLGAMIGYHPATRRTIDKLHEADMPHVYVMYAVIGAVIGVAVREFGTVVGVVVFGIGGLIRFAVIITVFAFTLIYVFDSSPPFRIKIEGLHKARTADCAEAYRGILKEQGCSIIAEHRSTEKERIEFVFRLSRRCTRDRLEAELRKIADDLRGEVDWEVG
jgi:hypothetical protein